MLSKILTFLCGMLAAFAVWAVLQWWKPMQTLESALQRSAGTHWGIKLTVTYELQGHRGSDESDQVYSVQAIYKLHNWDDKAWKFKMPPVRSMSGLDHRFMQYVQADRHQEEWQGTQDFQLLPGETKTFRHEITILMKERLRGDLSQKKETQVALVFDLPDDGDVKEWVTGTILSEPVVWDDNKLKQAK